MGDTTKKHPKIYVKNEEEMVAQLKLLLSNGYTVAVQKVVNDLNLTGDCASYTIAYMKPKGE